MDQTQALMDILRMVRRRFALIAIVAGLGIIATGFVAFILPPVYQSEARILVESQQIPDELARSTVTASASERLEVIRQRLMARDNLQKQIDEFALFADRPDLSLTKKIERLRDATVILPITAPGPRYGETVLSAFLIQVTLSDPEKAARVANEFVTIVLDQNALVRTQRATDTLTFFKKEAERIGTEITALEEEISAFKHQNEDALPESLDFRHDQLSQLDESELSIGGRLLTLHGERSTLTSQLNEARLGISTTSANPQIMRLREHEAELARLRTVYRDSHHLIRALLAQIAALRAELPEDTSSAEEVAREARIENLNRRIKLFDDQIDVLRKQRASFAQRRAELQDSIQRTSDVEITLNAYERNLEGLQEQLSVIVHKRVEAETGEKLEVNQQAERFEVIEQALIPERPISPNRKKITLLGSGASLGLALGLAFLIEMLWPAIRSASQMQRQLDLRPVVVIPHISTKRERRGRFAKGFLLILLLGIGVPASLYFVDQHVMPLHEIGEKLVEKTGMAEFIRIIEARL